MPNPKTNHSRLAQAGEIATSSLRECYSEYGILAGTHQFSDYWARDGLFACLGALAIGDIGIVRKELELMLTFQGHDGQIPLRVGQYFIGLKMLGISNPKELKPRYDQDKYGSSPTDQNPLFIIAFSSYLEKAGDKKFLDNNYSQLKKAMEWCLSQDRDNDGLIEEGYYAGWTDSLRKKGRVFYTNVLCCEALGIMAEFAAKTGHTDDTNRYKTLCTTLRSALNTRFWNGRYYSDWIDPAGKRHDYFSTEGNLLAILFNVAGRKNALSIQKSISTFGISDSVPSRTNHPTYPLRMQSPLDTLFGIGDYHNGLSWLWLGALDSLAKHRLGLKKEALAELDKIGSLIIRHKGVFEVYSKNGKPVKRLLYKSEHPFAWSAGLFLYALDEIGKIRSVN